MKLYSINNSFGFTLIEMMIAIFIFSIVSIMAYGGINYVLKGQNYLQTSSDQLRDMQLTFRYFEKDINQMKSLCSQSVSRSTTILCWRRGQSL